MNIEEKLISDLTDLKDKAVMLSNDRLHICFDVFDRRNKDNNVRRWMIHSTTYGIMINLLEWTNYRVGNEIGIGEVTVITYFKEILTLLEDVFDLELDDIWYKNL